MLLYRSRFSLKLHPLLMKPTKLIRLKIDEGVLTSSTLALLCFAPPSFEVPAMML